MLILESYTVQDTSISVFYYAPLAVLAFKTYIEENLLRVFLSIHWIQHILLNLENEPIKNKEVP